MTISVLAIAYASVAMRLSARIEDVYLFLSANTFSMANAVLVSLSIWVRAMAKGVQLLALPGRLSADYPIPHIVSLWDAALGGSVIILCVYVLVVVLLAKRLRLASFGLVWALVFLLPVSNIIPITLHFIAERYLYAPSIGL
jgi:hypothetical protein